MRMESFLDEAQASARPFPLKFMIFFARRIINVGINLTSRSTRQKGELASEQKQGALLTDDF